MAEESRLVKTVENEFVVKECLTYKEKVKVPKDLYELSRKEQETGLKQEHFFPGGYISPLGGVFSNYRAFNDYTQ